MSQKPFESTWDVSDFDSWTYDRFPLGAVCLEPGNSVKYSTGGWRSNRPIWDQDKCSNCMLCWVHCPDSSILVEDEKMIGIDYDHCKGCGVCAKECRFDALEMVLEIDAKGA
jgi:pyruvate ferredoxin oxidoreductase delta subunit